MHYSATRNSDSFLGYNNLLKLQSFNNEKKSMQYMTYIGVPGEGGGGGSPSNLVRNIN